MAPSPSKGAPRRLKKIGEGAGGGGGVGAAAARGKGGFGGGGGGMGGSMGGGMGGGSMGGGGMGSQQSHYDPMHRNADNPSTRSNRLTPLKNNMAKGQNMQ